ncbi:MAG TPA: hypothetical protein VJC05_03710 [Candidatus Andersenbacteria bacterium]|nr:hypothetical protein [Candidatus Andersenbacteria bacterium]
MAGERGRAAWLTAALLLVPAVLGLLWAWLLWQTTILEWGIARRWPWPVACTTRGCVTTVRWEQQRQARESFAQASGQPAPTAAEALTTLIRQRLVTYAQLQVQVTSQDAVRYREEILHAKDEAAVREATGLALADYDEYVILPLLRQEALKAERRIESLDELFRLLASERIVVVLSRGLVWDKATAQVVTR